MSPPLGESRTNHSMDRAIGRQRLHSRSDLIGPIRREFGIRRRLNQEFLMHHDSEESDDRHSNRLLLPVYHVAMESSTTRKQYE
jgi:hypothetical protein